MALRGAEARAESHRVTAARDDHREGNDDHSQAGALFRLLGAEPQGRLSQNIAEAMRGGLRPLAERQLGHLAKADPAYAAGVRAARVTLS